MNRLCCAKNKMRWGADSCVNQPKIKKAKLDIDFDNFDDSSGSDDEMPMNSSLGSQNTSLSILASQSLVAHRTKENPFLSPGVLRSLMKNIELPTEVKMLRPMCEAWNEVGVEELKERGLQGSIKPINLFVGSDLNDPPDSNNLFPVESFYIFGSNVTKLLVTFLDDTMSNPSLYRRIHLKYPKFLKPEDIKNLKKFFSFYKPSYLDLELNFFYGINTNRFNPRKTDDELLSAFLDNVGLNLRHLRISYPNTPSTMMQLLGYIVPQPLSVSGRFPKLQKLILTGEKSAALFREILSELEDTAPNLTALEFDFIDTSDLSMPRLFGQDFRRGSSILTRLTHLDIGRGGFDLSMLERSSWILLLSNAGMKLKYFSMQIDKYYDEEDVEEVNEKERFEDMHRFGKICLNLSAFFKTQAHSLVDLCLAFDIGSDSGNIEANDILVKWLKFQLPVFTNLTRLEIFDSCYMEVNGALINPLDLDSSNFPVLEELEIFGPWDLIKNFKNNQEPLALKRLKVTGGKSSEGTISEERDSLMRAVSKVEILEVGILGYGGLELPWTNSLKVLHFYQIYKPLKLRHLKNLKMLVIEEDGRNLTEWKYFDTFIKQFLHIRRLDLDLIRFRGFKMSEEIRQAIVDHFPYRVEVVESPIIWNPYD